MSQKSIYVHPFMEERQLKKKTMYVTYKHCFERFCKKILRKKIVVRNIWGNQAARGKKYLQFRNIVL